VKGLFSAFVVVGLVALCEAIPQSAARLAVRSNGDKPEGKAAYARTCEACHGPDGAGATAPALVPFTLELSELITIVRQGIGVMPGIPRDRVSDDEIAAIRDYLIDVKK
jgi:mono/diheme cytochrome c family protein